MKRARTQHIHKSKPILEIVGAIMIFLFGALLAFLLVGCNPVEPWPEHARYRVEAAPELISDWEMRVEQSTYMWRATLGADCPFPFVYDDDASACPVRLVAPTDWEWDSDFDGAEDDCFIDIRGVDPWRVDLGILVHEWGHAFGLGHSQDRSSVMHADDQPFEPSPEDISNARAALGCGGNS